MILFASFQEQIFRMESFNSFFKKIKLYIFILSLNFLITSSVLALSYRVIEEKQLPGQIGTFRHLQFESDNYIDFFVVRLNDHYQAEFYRQMTDSSFSAETLDNLSLKENFVVAINGGFFTEQFKPAGLYIEKGTTIQKSGRNSLLTSCIKITKNKLVIMKNLANCFSAYDAIQTGPLLIYEGKVAKKFDKKVESLNLSSKKFYQPKRRTILALADHNQLLLMVTTSATLFDVTEILTKQPAAVGVNKIIAAINLDGGSSSAMYVRFPDKPFYFNEFKHVNNFILVH